MTEERKSPMKKPLFALVLSLMLLLTACAPGQTPETAPAPEPESPSSVSEPAAEPEPEPESAPESQSSQPEPEPESTQPEESSSDPNGPWENPDTSILDTPETEERVARGYALEKELESTMPKEIYCWFHVWNQGEVGVEIGTNNKKALEEFLVNWQGTKWDKLEIEPADHSRAEAEALAKKIVDCHYDFGPGAVCEVMEVDGMIWVSADFQKEEDIIFPMPEELARLAEEAGLSEIVKYSASVNGGRAYEGPTTSPDRTITNPDT